MNRSLPNFWISVLTGFLAFDLHLHAALQIAPATDDLWDVSKGVTISGSSTIWPRFFASDIFGTMLSVHEPGNTVFQDFYPEGYVHSVEWRTPNPIVLSAFNLFASGNPNYNSIDREFAQFVLKAKRHSADEFITIYSFTPTHPYTFVDPTSSALVAAQFEEPVEGRYFRAEFVQWNSASIFNGPRVIELDGFGSELPPEDDAPVASAQSISLFRDLSASITLTAVDGDGGPALFAIQSGPTNGTLSGIPPNLTYTPDPGYEGADAFEFSVRSGSGEASYAWVTITIHDEVLLPSQQDLWDVSQGSTITGTSGIRLGFAGTDMFGTTLSVERGNTVFSDDFPNGFIHFVEWKTRNPVALNAFSLFAQGSPWGSVNEREFGHFVLKAKLNGTDEFATIYAFDPTHPYTFIDSTNALLLSAVLPAPVEAQFFRAEFVQWNGTRISFNGPRVIELDGFGRELLPFDEVPVAIGQSLSMDEDSSIEITLSAEDADGGENIFEIISAPANGTLTGTVPNLTYRPNTNFFGVDSFEFSVASVMGESSTASVNINVMPVNDAPTVVPVKTLTTAEDAELPFELFASDPDGDALNFEITSAPQRGTLSGLVPHLLYTPNANFYGQDIIRYRVSDGAAQSEIATWSISVAPVDDAPAGLPAVLQTNEDSPVSFEPTILNPDGDDYTISVVREPANGLIADLDGLRYVPNENFFGTDSFDLQVRDANGNGNVFTITVQVAPVNDAPIAKTLSVSSANGVSVSIALSATDAENSPLSYTVVSAPANGTLSGTVPNVVFTPAAGWSGTTSFTYIAHDGLTASAPATVTISVSAPMASAALYFDFEELGGTQVNDLSGNALAGFLRNGSSWTAGIVGAGAINFPLPSDYLEVAAAPAIADLELQGNGGMTISFWMYTPTLMSGTIISKGVGNSVSWQIQMTSSGRLVFFRNHAGPVDLSLRFENQVVRQTWQHFVFTWTGGPGKQSVQLYRNGVLQTLSSGSEASGEKRTDASNALYIGGTPAGSGVNAAVDDFRAYNRILTPQEIAELFSQND